VRRFLLPNLTLFVFALLSPAQEATVRLPYEQIAAERWLWPPQVTLKSSASLSLKRDGVVAGMIELPAGRQVDVVALTPDSIQIRFGSARGEVAPSQTDILELVSGATMARQVQNARIALIEEARSLVTTPTTTPTPAPSPTPTIGEDPLFETEQPEDTLVRSRPLLRPAEFNALSDEFEDPSSIEADWIDLSEAEDSYDHFSRVEIPRHDPGQLVITPRTSAWYQQYHGNLLFKEIRGDFLAMTRIEAGDKTGRHNPEAWYSMAGLMVRAPAPEGPQNYVFIGIGSTEGEGTMQLQSKSVINSGDPDHDLRDSLSQVELGIARLGTRIITLQREIGEQWNIVEVYDRPDFPVLLQVGVTAYGDLLTAKQVSPEVHNARGIRDGDPDLRARFEFVRFRPPVAALRQTDGLEKLREFINDKPE